MSLQKAEQAILNAIYGAIAWLLLDLGILFQTHGDQFFSALGARPEMAVGAIIAIACIVGLIYKSRVASILLFLFFLVPPVVRAVQGVFPTTMVLLFSLILLYFFLSGILGTFRYHHLKTLEREDADRVG